MGKPTYEELEAQVKQLAAENAAMKSNAIKADSVIMSSKFEYWSDRGELSEAVRLITETPATDAAIASLRAEGAEMFAEVTINIGKEEGDESIVYAGQQALLFAAQLRSQSAPSPEINDASDIEPFGFVRRSGDQVVIDVNGDPHIKDGMPVYTRQSEQVKGVQS